MPTQRRDFAVDSVLHHTYCTCVDVYLMIKPTIYEFENLLEVVVDLGKDMKTSPLKTENGAPQQSVTQNL